MEVRSTWLRFKSGDATLADEILSKATPEANEWAGVRAFGRFTRHRYTETLKNHGVSMNFRLNDFHLEIPQGKKRRGKRTRAKERVYKHINQRIRAIYPNFNIGISTRKRQHDSRWSDPYRHWRLMPKAEDRVVEPGSKKDKKK